ncbi:MAG: metallophosphoesterase family protein [Burkholderiales bacterium]|nr:metallophosphatase family protein [Sulfuricellaceae bacterium]
MKICIISDSHDNHPLMVSAVSEAKEQGAEAVLHCGDVVAPSILRKLQALGLPVHVIYGNNAGDLYAMARMAHEPGSLFHFHGQDGGIDLGGRRIFLVHYPHYARAMACTGEWDMVCCGHDHKANIEAIPNIKGGSTLLLNPGTVGGIAAPATYILGDLADMTFAIVPVPEPVPA